MASGYVVYGLRVSSDLELDAEPCDASEFDVQLVLDTREALALNAPQGTLLAEFGGVERGFWIVRTADAYVLGIRNLLEARMALDLKRVELAPAPGVARDLLSTIAQGTVLASLLTLSGTCVLHASAVELSGRAVVFLGPSGCGKSMLAALCCTAGARLITDDLLVVRQAQRLLCCEQGTTRLRLRQNSADILELLPVPARLTADERWALLPQPAPPDVPLGAILLPERAADDRSSLVRLSPARAAITIASCPRIPGWHDERVLGDTFRHAARVARNVPTYSLRLPGQMRSTDALRKLVLTALGEPAAPGCQEATRA
jgi:hypothetical protein